MCFGTMCVLIKDYWWGEGVFRGDVCVLPETIGEEGEGVFWDDVCVLPETSGEEGRGCVLGRCVC